VFLYGETFGSTQLRGFACIWLALAIYATDGLIRLRRNRIP
jgi:chloramphenicol-sensitive protein RarD